MMLVPSGSLPLIHGEFLTSRKPLCGNETPAIDNWISPRAGFSSAYHANALTPRKTIRHLELSLSLRTYNSGACPSANLYPRSSASRAPSPVAGLSTATTSMSFLVSTVSSVYGWPVKGQAGKVVWSSVQPVCPSGCCPRKSDLSASGFRVSWGVPCWGGQRNSKTDNDTHL